MPTWEPSNRTRSLWYYRMQRSVNAAYRATRRALRDRVVRSRGNYGDLWDPKMWTASADRSVVPTMQRLYRDVAFQSADGLGLLTPLGDRWLEAAVDLRLSQRLPILYGVADTIEARVLQLAQTATTEDRPSGWLLDRLGLEEGSFSSFAAGPMSPGLAARVAETETTAGIGVASVIPLDGLDGFNEDDLEEILGPVEDDLTLDGLFGLKTWQCRFVNSRRSHMAANGQTQVAGGFFRVGSSFGAYPGDPEMPPKEVINCQCWMSLEVLPVTEVNRRTADGELDVAEDA